MDALNTWIGTAFAPENLDRTVQALVESQGGARETGDHDQARQRRDEAQAKLRWFQAAIAAGIDPAALVDVSNEAEAVRAAAQAEPDNTPVPNLVTAAEVYAMVDSLDDIPVVNAPHLVALVRAGARFERGHPIERPETLAA
ncbi:hypothetical protein ACFT7S_16070 [Streptomyces sp. NPDC057136]|uniref:hypothetical protein n=1 Tax=Streptomyces sp. NPDC057136 TaxID=3346029 RepID=UPI00363185E2